MFAQAVRRLRKIDVYALAVTVVLAVTTRGENSLANLHRAFQLRSGARLARSIYDGSAFGTGPWMQGCSPERE